MTSDQERHIHKRQRATGHQQRRVLSSDAGAAGSAKLSYIAAGQSGARRGTASIQHLCFQAVSVRPEHWVSIRLLKTEQPRRSLIYDVAWTTALMLPAIAAEFAMVLVLRSWKA